MTAELAAGMNPSLREVPETILLAGVKWSSIVGQKLIEDTLSGTHVHDPNCDAVRFPQNIKGFSADRRALSVWGGSG